MVRVDAKVATRLSKNAARIIVFRRLLLAWFKNKGREFPWRTADASAYNKVVSEILLQRTRAETVALFFPRFVQHYPTWHHLKNAADEELRVFLKPIGLWRRRAAVLRMLGTEMTARQGRFPKTRREIETLPGIGQYVASAVMLFCHGKRQPLLDANMARVLERCFGSRKLVDIRYDPWLQALARRVVNHRRAPQLNWAILDLAAKVCTIREPRCTECPLKMCCRYALAGKVQ